MGVRKVSAQPDHAPKPNAAKERSEKLDAQLRLTSRDLRTLDMLATMLRKKKTSEAVSWLLSLDHEMIAAAHKAIREADKIRKGD